MAKDRGRPFSRKHRKYWIPVTGGMIVIGAINVGLGMCTYDPPKDPPKRIELDIPKLPPGDAGTPTGDAVIAPSDAIR